MKTAIVWFVTLIVNIANPFGMLAFLLMFTESHYDALLIPACIAPLGFVFGIFCWSENIAPRMFWVKSRTDLFGSRVKSAFGYMLGFFNLACLITGLVMVL